MVVIKLKILDGDTHKNLIDEFELNTKVSLHNMAFMPISPNRIQIIENKIIDDEKERYFIICAGEGGGLNVIESTSVPEDPFTLFQYLSDEEEAQLLSSSVHGYCDTSFYWVLNYWDGKCKVKKYFWNKNEHEYIFDNINKLELIDDEIIDFQTRLTPGDLKLALLERVLVINPITLHEITTYEELVIDKFEHTYSHELKANMQFIILEMEVHLIILK